MSTTGAGVLASLLRQHRLSAGLTQEELAEHAGISERSVSDLERGLTRKPYRDTLRRLADALCLNAEERGQLEAEARRARSFRAHDAAGTSANVHPTNLPFPLTSFVGREQELQAVCGLLQSPGGRLVSLIGTGGIGKTRLALAAGHTLLPQFEDGVFFVALAPISNPDLVMATIASALGVGESAHQSLLDCVLQVLYAKRLLLILDNLEHLLDAAPLFATVVERAPGVRLLATSRAPLSVYGEQELVVPPLSVPDLKGQWDVAKLMPIESVTLFVERVQAVLPDFGLTNLNAPDIINICRQLEGLPLAIELAAARVRLFPPSELLARLDSKLSLLRDGPRNVATRQQSLRATLDWSYDLLTPAEQQIFRRLAVFRGGATRHAAEAVCYVEEGPTVPPAIHSLTDQSLLLTLHVAGRDDRYVMLETIREYASERSEENGELEQLRKRHAEYFFSFTEKRRSEEHEAGQVTYLDRMQEEIDNLRAALRWLLDAGNADRALQMGLNLMGLWDTRCYYDEGKQWLEEALARGTDQPVGLRAQGFRSAAWLAIARGEYRQAVLLSTEGLRLFRELQDRAGIGGILGVLAMAAMQLGEYTSAERNLEECLAVNRELADVLGEIGALHLLSEVALDRAEYERAVLLADASVALARKHGYHDFLIHNLDNLARALLLTGDLARAAPLWEEGLQRAAAMQDPRDMAYHLEGMAAVAAHRGLPARAACLAGAATALRKEIHSPLSVPETAILQRLLAPARMSIDETDWIRAEAHGQSLSREAAIDYALHGTDA